MFRVPPFFVCSVSIDLTYMSVAKPAAAENKKGGC